MNLPRRFTKRMTPLIACVMLFSLAACGTDQTSNTPASSEPSDLQASYVTAESLRELVAQHPVVVIGHVVERGEVVNMARDVKDISQPDASTFILGQTYHVQVDRYLKGAGDSSLQVLQPEGFINQERTSVTEASINQARETYAFVPMATGKSYLLFLTPVLGFPEDAYFTGIEHPWRFSIPRMGRRNRRVPGVTPARYSPRCPRHSSSKRSSNSLAELHREIRFA